MATTNESCVCVSRARVLIEGWVQGVFFRATTRKVAEELGVRGWVRNLPDGRVEAVFEGPMDVVGRAVQWCYNGPSSARVSNVEVQWEEPVGEEGFRIA